MATTANTLIEQCFRDVVNYEEEFDKYVKSGQNPYECDYIPPSIKQYVEAGGDLAYISDKYESTLLQFCFIVYTQTEGWKDLVKDGLYDICRYLADHGSTTMFDLKNVL